MKKLIIIAILLLETIAVTAQRNVEKTVKTTKGEKLFLEFKFAETIEVKQWNKNEVKVKAKVTINDGEGDKHFSIKTSKEEDVLKIYADYGGYFKKRNNWKRKSTTTEMQYTVYVPNDVDLKVKSISGDLSINKFRGDLLTELVSGDVRINELKGNLRTKLVSGDVNLKKYEGELKLKTVSGNLDVSISKAKVSAKTLTGTIYSNLEIKTDRDNSRSSSYNKVRGTINNGNTLVKMETVSGNIYMRKVK